MKRANSGMTWIQQKLRVTDFLRQLAVHPRITHDTIDALPRSWTRDYIGGLLAEHGVPPRRDETKVRYQEWAQDPLERLTDEATSTSAGTTYGG